jgi:hypothetical protein
MRDVLSVCTKVILHLFLLLPSYCRPDVQHYGRAYSRDQLRGLAGGIRLCAKREALDVSTPTFSHFQGRMGRSS